MGWCKAHFAAHVRINTPSWQVVLMRVAFDISDCECILSTVQAILSSSFP
jgi:hypothetical protein